MKVGDYVNIHDRKFQVVGVYESYIWAKKTDSNHAPSSYLHEEAKPWVEPIQVGDMVTAGAYTYSVLADVKGGWVLESLTGNIFWEKKNDSIKFHSRPEKAKS